MASQPHHPRAIKEKKRISIVKHAHTKKVHVSLTIIYLQGKSHNNNNRIKVLQYTLSTDKVF